MAAPTSRLIGHNEYAAGKLDTKTKKATGRKIDPRYNMNWRRDRVEKLRRGGGTTKPPEGDDVMNKEQEERLITAIRNNGLSRDAVQKLWAGANDKNREWTGWTTLAYLASWCREMVLAQRAQIKKDAVRDATIAQLAAALAGDFGADLLLSEVRAAAEAGARDAQPSIDEVADAIASRLDPDVDRAVIHEVLREMFGVANPQEADKQ